VYEEPITEKAVIIGIYLVALDTMPPSISTESFPKILSINRKRRGKTRVKKAAAGFLRYDLLS
jgi:hypothetical protein